MPTHSVALLLCFTGSAAFVPLPVTPGCRFGPRTPRVRPVVAADATLLVADAAVLDTGLMAQLSAWTESHAFLYGVIITILTRYIVSELRARIEKPVIDEVTGRVTESVQKNLTPDREAITTAEWTKLVLCIALDIAGDASELIPILGEATDLGFAPVEAALLKSLFQSNLIAGLGFVEEILPFTDIIPTFTLSWCLRYLWPTTPLAQRLMPDAVGRK